MLILEGALDTADYLRGGECGKVFKGVVEWLHNCRSLDRLDLLAIPDSVPLLMELFACSKPKLSSPTIHIDSFHETAVGAFYSALAGQTRLQFLSIWIEHVDD
mgnify:CR=1 FL=1